jgi:geranylgeranyl diphosphate synthase type I
MKVRAVEELALACEQCFRGELLDVVMEGREDVSEDEFIHMVDLKTGSYTTCLPLVIGGIFGGLKDVKMLKDYGKLIGRAFQIKDDILGTFGDDRKTGKPTSSDIRQGKKTLLVIYVLKNGGLEERKFLRSKLGSEVSQDDMEKIRHIMIKGGAVDYSLKKIEYYTDLARESLLSSPLKCKDFFLQFTDYLKKRKF